METYHPLLAALVGALIAGPLAVVAIWWWLWRGLKRR